MVSEGRLYLATHWWVSTFPGLAITTSALGFNLLGDALRDALEVKF
jgi:peptide/nickel transport system permease protein